MISYEKITIIVFLMTLSHFIVIFLVEKYGLSTYDQYNILDTPKWIKSVGYTEEHQYTVCIKNCNITITPRILFSVLAFLALVFPIPLIIWSLIYAGPDDKSILSIVCCILFVANFFFMNYFIQNHPLYIQRDGAYIVTKSDYETYMAKTLLTYLPLLLFFIFYVCTIYFYYHKHAEKLKTLTPLKLLNLKTPFKSISLKHGR